MSSSPPSTADAQPPLRWSRADAAAATAYAVVAFWMLSRLFVDPRGTYLSQGVQDQQAFEWYFGATAHSLATFSNPLFSTLQNHPTGVNMLANATVMGLGIPFAPITLTLGPHWTFLLIEWLGFAATAWCWYALFVRRMGAHRAAAFIGGLFVGFSPAMVSHGNGHPNFLAQFLVPVIIDRLIDLGQAHPRRLVWRKGTVLGLVVTWQLWMGEEVLLLAAVGIAIAALAMLVQRRLPWRTMLPGVAIGVLTTVLLFAFPLWWQFAGPQSYTSMWQPVATNDLASLWGRATRTIGADPWASAALSMNRTEENAFFGVPLWPVLLGLVVLLLRRPVVRASALVVLVSVWLSLGSEVTLHGKATSIPGLWSLVADLPLFESVLPTRLTLVTVPAAAAILVAALDWAIRRSWGPTRVRVRQHSGDPIWQRWGPLGVIGVAVTLALAPMVPTRLWADPRPVVPEFFTSGDWRSYLDGGAVLGVPPPDIVDMRANDWQASARWEFPLVEGYFMGPDGSGSGVGTRGAVRRPFSQWLAEIARDQVPRVATPIEIEQFRSDLRFWRADLVVLPPRPDNALLRVSVESVLGPATESGGVAFWDVRRWRDG
ncbi:MAG TPA: hypothetical protein PK868_06350 [Phycicoccus sp.]|jgi:hypothetical protein|nr:hypothetical protein [Phycicoccus sp.]HQK30042.1 hypothetical protein [Phycicoccus sp.]HQY97004.1 hypothetical protein [Phycicoccus sp.]